MTNEVIRGWVYRVGLATLLALAMLRVIGPDELPGWIEVLEVALGVGAAGLASANTPARRR